MINIILFIGRHGHLVIILVLILGECKCQKYLHHGASCSQTVSFCYLQVHDQSALQMLDHHRMFALCSKTYSLLRENL